MLKAVEKVANVISRRFYRLILSGLIAFLVLYPLSMLFLGSFRDAAPGLPGEFSIQGYIDIFSSFYTYQVLWDTFWLAAIKTLFAVGLAVFFAWLVHRTDIPWRRFLENFVYLRFFLLPPLPMLLGWILLLSPRSGTFNQYFMQLTGSDAPLFNIFSYGGIIFTSVTFTFSLYFIFISPAMQSMDVTLEESSRMSGASKFTTLRRVTLPLLMPAILATTILSFIRGMESFEAPLLLGTPAKIYVLSTQIYSYISYEPTQYPPAMALSVIFLVFTFILVVSQWRILGTRQFTTVRASGYKAGVYQLGRLRYPLLAVALFFLVVTTLPPMVVLVQSTFMKIAGVYDVAGSVYTLKHYALAFTKPELWRGIRNTMIVAGGGATIGMIICTLVSYMVVRIKGATGTFVDVIAWIPWSIPSIVLAMGFLWAYIFLPFPLYGTVWLLMIVAITRGLPLGVRTMSTTMVQISKELEEASRVHGASWAQTMLRIWLPLVSSGFIGGWIIVFCLASRDLSTMILLYTPKSTVISTIFFEFYSFGYVETAAIIGLIQSVFIAAAFIGVRLLSRWLLRGTQAALGATPSV